MNFFAISKVYDTLDMVCIDLDKVRSLRVVEEDLPQKASPEEKFYNVVFFFSDGGTDNQDGYLLDLKEYKDLLRRLGL